MVYDVAIIGSGAAGLGAAVYARRYLLTTVVIAGLEPGGYTATAGRIENYLGFPSVDGYELYEKFLAHVKANQADIVQGDVASIEGAQHCFLLRVGEKDIRAKSIIFAQGSEHRKLGLANEKALFGRGIHYCITCDGPLFKNKTALIVGGGDASVKGAVLLADYATHVTLVTREKTVLAEPVNLQRMKSKTNVEVYTETHITQLVGEKKLRTVVLSKPIKGQTDIEVDGVFVEIGSVPRSGLAQRLGVTLDEHGQIMVDQMMRTNVHAVFACGDITNATGRFKQIITGAAQGSIAATAAYQDIGEHGTGLVCDIHGAVHPTPSV